MTATHYWNVIARYWNCLGPPLRPCFDDTTAFSRLLTLPDRLKTDALILGVTPELYRLEWPVGSRIRAADRSRQMIDAIWPGPADEAIEADWLDLPLEDNSLDCVLCDGGLHLLQYPNEQRRLADPAPDRELLR